MDPATKALGAINPTPSPPRALNTFTMPKGVGNVTVNGTYEPLVSIGLVELTMAEEERAGEAAAGSKMRMPRLLTTAAVRAVNGKPVGEGDGSAEIAVASMSSAARTLLGEAFNAIHNPPEGSIQPFLATRVVSTL